MKEIDKEKILRRWAIREAVEKQMKFFEANDPEHTMNEETDLNAFVGDNSQPLQTDKNGFIDFENAYDE